MAPSRLYAPEIKAKALAAVSTGASVNSIAKQLGVSRRAVQLWRDQAGLRPLVSQRFVSQQNHQLIDLGQLIADSLAAGIAALVAIANAASDPEWIKRQDARQLAIFYGVLADKQLRVLAGLRPAEPFQVGSTFDVSAPPE